MSVCLRLRLSPRPVLAAWVVAALAVPSMAAEPAQTAPRTPAEVKASAPAAGPTAPPPVRPAAPAGATPTSMGLTLDAKQISSSVQTVGLFALLSLAPVAVLMVTAFVRINIVLTLLRQALGSPQVPGNQVLAALAILLTALVMWPVGNDVYTRAIEPYAAGRIKADAAWEAGSKPIKAFMVGQIEQTGHKDYLWELHDYVVPPTAGRVDPVYGVDFPLRVVAPAYLLSELTTALVIGFYVYLPFLVIDLVVSAVLAAMGLFMLPPSLVALPLKLILFVLADGWMLVATMLLQSFGRGG
jgi:flagellar biosynthetic protein FliP